MRYVNVPPIGTVPVTGENLKEELEVATLKM